MPDLIERLSDEADLCRNEGADDIANLLDEACSALRTVASEKDHRNSPPDLSDLISQKAVSTLQAEAGHDAFEARYAAGQPFMWPASPISQRDKSLVELGWVLHATQPAPLQAEQPAMVPLTDEQIDAICAPGRATRWANDGRQYDRDTARLIETAVRAKFAHQSTAAREQDERELFVKTMHPGPPSPDRRDADGSYKNSTIECQWEGWEARAALSHPPAAVEAVPPARDSAAWEHPLLPYADSYRRMAKMGDGKVNCWSVVTDIERNMIPITQALSPPGATALRPLRTEQIDEVLQSLDHDAREHESNSYGLPLRGSVLAAMRATICRWLTAHGIESVSGADVSASAQAGEGAAP